SLPRLLTHSLLIFSFSLSILRPPTSPLFPYTTLFRSEALPHSYFLERSVQQQGNNYFLKLPFLKTIHVRHGLLKKGWIFQPLFHKRCKLSLVNIFYSHLGYIFQYSYYHKLTNPHFSPLKIPKFSNSCELEHSTFHASTHDHQD